ncbi:protein phosphatase 1 regulatory subunit 1B isoform X1 [Epinephelus lanceolatus]
MEPSVSTEVEGEPKERKKIQFAVSPEVEGEPKERKKIQFAVSTEVEGEPKERKKIQFAVPASVPTNLDPRQVEMIRRRRPTPATLFRVADQSSPDDDQSTHQVKWVVGENGVLKPKRVNPNVYQPPSLRAVQKMAEAHMQHLGVYPPFEDPCEGEEDEDHWQGEEGEDTSPTKAADHQETATTEQSDKFSSVRETAKQIQAAQEEEEEEEEEGDKIKETTEENSRGSY